MNIGNINYNANFNKNYFSNFIQKQGFKLNNKCNLLNFFKLFRTVKLLKIRLFKAI